MKNVCWLTATMISASTLSSCMSLPPSAPAQGSVHLSRCQDVHIGMTFDEANGLVGSPVKKLTEHRDPDGSAITAYQYSDYSVIHFSNGAVSFIACR